jgi:hypothetical protein
LSTDTIQISEDDFLKSGYQEIINSCDKNENYKYATKFLQKAREFESESDFINSEIFTLIGRLSSLNLKSESALKPFSPMPSGPVDIEPQSFTQIFSREHLDLLKDIALKVVDFELQARIADVIWVIDRDYKMAEIAINAYIESAKKLEHPEHWTSCEQRIQRAFRLSNLLGKNSSHINIVLIHIESVLEKYNGEDPLFLSERLMSLLIESKHGDPDKYSILAEKCAIDAETKNNFHRARAYWQVKAQWHKIQNNVDKEREALLNNAASYVKEAEFKRDNNGKGSFLVASHFLQRAIEAYRRLSNTNEIVDGIHRKLLGYEEQSINEMQKFSTEFDVSESVRNTINNVSGKDLYDALFALSLMIQSPKVDKLKEEVKRLADQYPLQHIFGGVAVNHMGKVIGRQASMLSSDPDEVEEATRQNMLKHAEYHRLIMTQSVIEPARHQIILEHNPQLSDIMPLVYNNPFVPEGREVIYAEGLLKGLEGDFLCALHLLIPQVENTMRHILRKRGVLTSSIDSAGIQDERSLNDTLFRPEIIEIFGNDIIFDLQGLLVERFGANLRNRMAHGLMDHTAFFSIHASYMWGMTLRLCCWPLIIKKHQEKQKNLEKTEDETTPQNIV